MFKSSLVLVVACWEAFVEDVGLAAFDYLLKHSADPSGFPNKVFLSGHLRVQSHVGDVRIRRVCKHTVCDDCGAYRALS